ncbi:MAG: hypothetical protein WAR37_04880 [Candidatus Microsaccharimonas sp.]
MTEHIRHELNETGIHLRMPSDVLNQLVANDRLHRLISIKQKDRIFDFESDNGDDLIAFNYAKLGGMGDKIQRGNAIRRAIEVYDEITNFASTDTNDPRLMALLSLNRIEGRYAMDAWAKPADGVDFSDLKVATTQTMQQSARALNRPAIDIPYIGAHFVPDEHFVFNTGSIHGSVLSTDGHVYTDELGRIELSSGNFYSDIDQFIALAGLVAFIEGKNGTSS